MVKNTNVSRTQGVFNAIFVFLDLIYLEFILAHLHPWAVLKGSILNRVKGYNTEKIVFCWMQPLNYLKILTCNNIHLIKFFCLIVILHWRKHIKHSKWTLKKVCRQYIWTKISFLLSLQKKFSVGMQTFNWF